MVVRWSAMRSSACRPVVHSRRRARKSPYQAAARGEAISCRFGHGLRTWSTEASGRTKRMFSPSRSRDCPRRGRSMSLFLPQQPFDTVSMASRSANALCLRQVVGRLSTCRIMRGTGFRRKKSGGKFGTSTDRSISLTRGNGGCQAIWT